MIYSKAITHQISEYLEGLTLRLSLLSIDKSEPVRMLDDEIDLLDERHRI